MGCNCLKSKSLKDKIKKIKKVITRDVKEIWTNSKDERVITQSDMFEIKK